MLFAAGAVEAQTGVDLAMSWRGYRSLATGHKKLERAGYATHVHLIEDLLPEIAPMMGQVGDIAVLDGREEDCIGVVQGSMIYALSLKGLAALPLTDASRVFRVGST